MEEDKTKKVVKKHYADVVKENKGCCSCRCKGDGSEQISKEIGYSDQQIKDFSDANLGLGCGNPTAIADIKNGDVVLDLGSGAGFDCFHAARRVGDFGKVIGVDMTEEMIQKAEVNAKNYCIENVEFRLGEIEKLPVDDDSVDIIISNCVINLAPDKLKVFQESYRVLKNTGRMFVSDIVLLEELSPEQREDENLVATCVGGALLKDKYLNLVRQAGFKVEIISENKEISKTQYQGINLESLSLKLLK